jgi:TatD DNase family protein
MFVNLHTHSFTIANQVISVYNLPVPDALILNDYPERLYSIGIHPWYAVNSKVQIAEIEKAVIKHNVIAIGECGLDKLKGPDLSEQILVFEQQILIAEKVNKPVIIHCVKAFNELIQIKKRIKPTVPLIIHGFRNNATIAKQLHNEGFLLSFCPQSLANSSLVNELPAMLSNNVFFLETDDIESEVIIELYSKVAELLGVSLNSLQEGILSNFKKVFNVILL